MGSSHQAFDKGVRLARYTRLVWSDEFNGPAGTPPAQSKWIHQVGAWGYTNNELETYTNSPANAALDGHGHLAIIARRQTATGPDGRRRNYTSARIETHRLLSATHGLIEARMKIPAGAGLWPAFWMLGSDAGRVGWPACGEVDVLEARGQNPSVAYGFLHGPSTEDSSQRIRPRTQVRVRELACVGLPHLRDQLEPELDHVAGRRRTVWHRNRSGSFPRHKVGLQPSVPPRAQSRRRWQFWRATELIDTLSCDAARRLGSGLSVGQSVRTGSWPSEGRSGPG